MYSFFETKYISVIERGRKRIGELKGQQLILSRIEDLK